MSRPQIWQPPADPNHVFYAQQARNRARFGTDTYPGGVRGDWPDFPDDFPDEQDLPEEQR